jgi:hypothetical protein
MKLPAAPRGISMPASRDRESMVRVVSIKIWEQDGGHLSHCWQCGLATYKVDTDAIVLKVKQEFATKETAKKQPKPEGRLAAKKRAA